MSAVPATTQLFAAAPSAAPTAKIGVINGLRGYATLGVIWHHFAHGLDLVAANMVQVAGLFLHPLAPLACGWMGVKLFFLLSGFVLYLPYVQGKRSMATAEDRRKFWVRRAQRLLPLFYVCSAVCLALLAVKGGLVNRMMWVGLLGSGTFIFSPRTYAPAPNWVLWSLGVEIWFSVIFPAVVLLAAKMKVHRLFLLALGVALLMRFVALPLGWAENHSPYHHWIGGSLPGAIDDFLWGMVAAQLYVVWSQRDWAQAWLRRSLLLVAVGSVILYIGCLLCVAVELGTLGPVFKPLLSPVYMSGFFLFTVGVIHADWRPVRAIFGNFFIQLTGLMCFSIYVWHGVAIEPITQGVRTPLTFAMYLVLVYAISLVTYRFVEFGYERDWRKLLPERV